MISKILFLKASGIGGIRFDTIYRSGMILKKKKNG